MIEGIADRYLKGEGLPGIADSIPSHYHLSYSYITKIFHNLCGTTWQVNFKKEKNPIVFNIPPLLSDEKIEAVKKKLEFNRTYTKANQKRHTFLLSGFVWCMVCGRALTAQSQKPTKRNGKIYSYDFYRHPSGKRVPCKALTSIRTNIIESAIMDVIWENLADEDSGFQSAWEDNYPDVEKIDRLKEGLTRDKKRLRKAQAERDKLVEAFLNKLLSGDTIKEKDRELTEEILLLKAKIADKENILMNMPSPEEVANQLRELKRSFKDYYYSKERFDSMSFEEKRFLLFSVFDGVDDEGNKLGVSVKRISKFREHPARFEYYISARFFAGYLDSDVPPGGSNNHSGGSGTQGKSSPEDGKDNKHRGQDLSSDTIINGCKTARFLNGIDQLSSQSYKSSRRCCGLFHGRDSGSQPKLFW